jgi:hypothetical protein
MKFNDLGDTSRRAGDLLGVANLRVRFSRNLERGPEIAVVVCRVDGWKIQFYDKPMKLRGCNPIRIDPPVSIQPAA